MISSLARYISDCPYLDGEKVNVNYLKKENASISLEMTKERSLIREYADGGTLKGITFVLALRMPFIESEGVRNSEKCQKIEKWIEEQNSKGCLPKLNGTETVISLRLKKGFAPGGVYGNFARYEAEIELIYYI